VRDQLFKAIFSFDDLRQLPNFESGMLIHQAIRHRIAETTVTGLAISHCGSFRAVVFRFPDRKPEKQAAFELLAAQGGRAR
jgi:hypothetical protein